VKGKTFRMALMLTLALTNSGAAQSAETLQSSTVQCVHVSNTTRFEVAAPLDRVSPLFGPEAERRWAGKHWQPEFLYPIPGDDVPGAVWTVKHGPFDSIWVNTLFDVPGGHMQYVSVIVGHLIMTVDVRVKSMTPSRTGVEVTYTRTALMPSANAEVRALGEEDRASGPDWQRRVESALEASKR
jgi:hypothetical protein